MSSLDQSGLDGGLVLTPLPVNQHVEEDPQGTHQATGLLTKEVGSSATTESFGNQLRDKAINPQWDQVHPVWNARFFKVYSSVWHSDLQSVSSVSQSESKVWQFHLLTSLSLW